MVWLIHSRQQFISLINTKNWTDKMFYINKTKWYYPVIIVINMTKLSFFNLIYTKCTRLNHVYRWKYLITQPRDMGTVWEHWRTTWICRRVTISWGNRDIKLICTCQSTVQMLIKSNYKIKLCLGVERRLVNVVQCGIKAYFNADCTWQMGLLVTILLSIFRNTLGGRLWENKYSFV